MSPQQQPIAGQLIAGEKILWQSVPGQGIRLRRSDAVLIPVGMLVLLFALASEVTMATVVRQLASDPGSQIDPAIAAFFPLFGAPFILVGLYLLGGRLIWDSHKRKRTFYTLTDKRALIERPIWGGVFGSKLVAVTLRDLGEVGLEMRKDGTGTISLGRDVRVNAGEGSYTKRAPRLDFLADAQRVYQLIEDARSTWA
jgi:hypothetical protein